MSEDPIQRGIRAEALLTDPLMEEAWAAARVLSIRAWEGSETPEAREAAWHQMQAVKTLRTLLEGVVEQGKLEEHKISLEEAREAREGLRRW